MARGFSIRAKIVCSIIVPALILMMVLYIDYVHLNSLGQSAELILSKNYKTIKACRQLKELLGLRRDFLLSSLLKLKRMDWNDVAVSGGLMSGLIKCVESTSPSLENVKS